MDVQWTQYPLLKRILSSSNGPCILAQTQLTVCICFRASYSVPLNNESSPSWGHTVLITVTFSKIRWQIVGT